MTWSWPVASSQQPDLCVLLCIYIAKWSQDLPLALFFVWFSIGSLEIPKTNSSCNWFTCLEPYVVVVQQRLLIRYMPITRLPVLLVPSVKSMGTFLLWTGKIGSLPWLRIFRFELTRYSTSFSPLGLLPMLPHNMCYSLASHLMKSCFFLLWQ
jgi:hypothetical protein